MPTVCAGEWGGGGGGFGLAAALLIKLDILRLIYLPRGSSLSRLKITFLSMLRSWKLFL